MDPLMMTLETPVLFLQRQVNMSDVKKRFIVYTVCIATR